MPIKSFFKVSSYSFKVSLVLLLLRLVAGSAMMIHGYGKIQAPLSWMGPDAGVPGLLQFLAAISEFGGGFAMMVGLLFALANLGILCTMAVATLMHMLVLKDPFVASQQGQGSYELAALYFVIALLFIVIGPGSFSLDKKIFK